MTLQLTETIGDNDELTIEYNVFDIYFHKGNYNGPPDECYEDEFCWDYEVESINGHDPKPYLRHLKFWREDLYDAYCNWEPDSGMVYDEYKSHEDDGEPCYDREDDMPDLDERDYPNNIGD